MKILREMVLVLLVTVYWVGFLGYQEYTSDSIPTVIAQPVNQYNAKNAGEHAIWQPGQTVTIYVDPNVTAETQTGVNNAIANWNNAGVVHLQRTDDVNNADIRVINGQLTDPHNIVFGLTQTKQTSQQINSALITINNQAIAKYHQRDDMSEQAYTNMVCTHEMGHALGLNHTTPGTNSVMQPGTDRNIQPYDIQRVQMLYNQK